MIMELNERLAQASRLRKAGYNCAQAVLMSTADITGISGEHAAVIGAPLGAGIGCGEICGVPNALAIATGLRLADPSPEGKKKAMPAAKALCAKFSAPYGGRLTCRELKGQCGRSCDELIAEGIALIHNA